jgi:hypothetical protein
MRDGKKQVFFDGWAAISRSVLGFWMGLVWGAGYLERSEKNSIFASISSPKCVSPVAIYVRHIHSSWIFLHE